MKKRMSILSYIKRRTALSAYKFYGAITASRRAWPAFIIIGAQKAGTTSLFKYLRQHPEVVPALKKEVKFFDCNFDRGLDWYRSHFPYQFRLSENKITGEASPHYIFHPLAPQRIANLLPKVKLIALLRNPIDRAYSHYQLNVRRGREPLSFEEAIEQEENRLREVREKMLTDESYPLYNFLHYSYLAKGIYVEQLKRWFACFPREQILIVKSEDFFADPAAVFQKVVCFLGLSPFELEKYKIHNIGNYSSMSPQTLGRLWAYFKPYNQRLYDYLGMDFGWESLEGRAGRECITT